VQQGGTGSPANLGAEGVRVALYSGGNPLLFHHRDTLLLLFATAYHRPNLRGWRSQSGDERQDDGEQAPCNGYLGQLEGDITVWAHTLALILIKPPDPQQSG
jgi:hypothetical protein